MDENIVKQFGTLSNFRSFLEEQISEKINDGAEISRGKDPNDKSKEEKKISKEVKKNADGSGTETHYDTSGEEMPPEDNMPPPAPPVDPTQAPGSQIAVGKKDVDGEADPKAIPIKLSGKKEKLNTKPKITVRDDGSNR